MEPFRVDLELSVLQPARSGLGSVASIAVTEQLVVGAGGTMKTGPLLVASTNARQFERRAPAREVGLRAALVVGDAVWICGEHGHLAVSRDGCVTWRQLAAASGETLWSLASASDGAVWVVGDRGFAARIVGDDIERISFATDTRLVSVRVIGADVVALGADGHLYRWRNGMATAIATGAERPLRALHVAKTGTWLVVGDGGFMARSPDGAWFSRVSTGVDVDLVALGSFGAGPLVCTGDAGTILVSRDDGRTWRRVSTSLACRLTAVERFGNGVLLGGDEGLIAKLAPPGDDTWDDRINAVGGAPALDVVFANGPTQFLARGLATYVAAFGGGTGPDVDGGAFTRVYGTALPGDAALLLRHTAGIDPASAFEELTPNAALLVDAGDGNLFERMLCAAQDDFLATGLVEAFCGTFCIGSLDNGDRYHMELYAWDGERQVVHYDHDDGLVTGVFADSLDSLVYLAALARAHDADMITDETYAIGLRKLRGKIAPTWHFAMSERDPKFTSLDAKRRDSEFFFYRSRWIVALLRNDGITDVDDIPQLFNADFNQVVPHDQLPARFEACEKFIPTALYAMWRAFLFDEPELVRYLEIARRHAARLVRDAAGLIDELRAGRNELGTIADVGAHLARFRALDLDPRRADARKVEAEARDKLVPARRREIDAELARTPPARWADLAWSWLDDGVAHRALLERLALVPEAGRQIAALDELRELPDGEREIALPRLAGELLPELEAILVGSLVRGDSLGGVPASAPADAEPTIIRDAQGRAIEVRGAASAEAAEAILHADHHAHGHAHAHDDDDDDHEHDHAHDHAHGHGASEHAHDADDDNEPPPSPDRIRAALALTSRALGLVPDDDEVQYTHAMLLLDAERAGLAGYFDELETALPGYTLSNRLEILARLGRRQHPRFVDALDVVMASELPEELGGGAAVAAVLSAIADAAKSAGREDHARRLYELRDTTDAEIDN